MMINYDGIMQDDNKKVTGRAGEEYAYQYLEKLGYKIVERNYQTRYGEIDLICRDDKGLVFVEVKTKTGLGFGSPEEMFDRRKLEKVRKMSTIYLGGKEVACRIDMIAVVIDRREGSAEIRHYKNVAEQF